MDIQGRALQAAGVGAKTLGQVYVYCVEETRLRPARLEWDEGVHGGSELREVTGEQATWAPRSHSTACSQWADEGYDLTHTLTGPLWQMYGKFTVRDQVGVEAGDRREGPKAVQARGDGGRDSGWQWPCEEETESSGIPALQLSSCVP